MKIVTYIALFSACSFLFFGLACFINPQMKMEFKRYGLASYRNLVGGLQLLGSIGTLVGVFFFPVVLKFAAAGLCLLMILGFLVRLKIKDSFLQSTPSLVYAVLNGYILYAV